MCGNGIELALMYRRLRLARYQSAYYILPRCLHSRKDIRYSPTQSVCQSLRQPFHNCSLDDINTYHKEQHSKLPCVGMKAVGRLNTYYVLLVIFWFLTFSNANFRPFFYWVLEIQNQNEPLVQRVAKNSNQLDKIRFQFRLLSPTEIIDR